MASTCVRGLARPNTARAHGAAHLEQRSHLLRVHQPNGTGLQKRSLLDHFSERAPCVRAAQRSAARLRVVEQWRLQQPLEPLWKAHGQQEGTYRKRYMQ
jgi:hypothetical protein